MRPKKFRLHHWYDSKRDKIMWGIQAHVGPKEWAHVYRDGKVCLYDIKADAEKAIADLRLRP